MRLRYTRVEPQVLGIKSLKRHLKNLMKNINTSSLHEIAGVREAIITKKRQGREGLPLARRFKGGKVWSK